MSVFVSVPQAALKLTLAGEQYPKPHSGRLLLGGPAMHCGVLSCEGEMKGCRGQHLNLGPSSQVIPGRVHPERRLW